MEGLLIMDKKNEIGLPVMALIFSIAPFLIFLLARINASVTSLLFISIIMPLTGIILGMTSLSKGKRKIGAVAIGM